MNNDSLDKSSNNKLSVSETSLDKLRDKVIRTTENKNKKLEKLQKFENEYYKTIDNNNNFKNNVDRDINNNIPTSSSKFLIV